MSSSGRFVSLLVQSSSSFLACGILTPCRINNQNKSVRTAQGTVLCNGCEVRGDVTIGANNVCNGCEIRGDVTIGANNVCNGCEIRGDVTIGANNVIHTQAAIIAEAGPIIIGNNNVIKERAVIMNRLHPGESPSSRPVLYIGNNNIFQVDSHSEALKIGNNNVLHSKCFVGRDVQVTDNCVVSSGCRLTCREVVGPNAVT